ncbi:MAG: YggS family pyridoxal phosphate-dependent enzyme [Clostridia bacterium]|nr:YggS family pyridoxal phosphate-dependent enzyme [Clostridia bacterium]
MDFENARKVLEKVYKKAPDVCVVAATKTVPASIMNQIESELNIKYVGENRVQELLSKYEEASECKTWHFIGQLQTNKVKYIINKVELIQSCDRLSLANEIERQASKINKVQSVLVEVNMAGEESKGGESAQNAIALIEEIAKLPHVKVEGLMSVLPNLEDKVLLDRYYDELYQLFEEVKKANIKNTDIHTLSAGMSGDWERAVDHGANMIRLGSILFGKRVY